MKENITPLFWIPNLVREIPRVSRNRFRSLRGTLNLQKIEIQFPIGACVVLFSKMRLIKLKSAGRERFGAHNSRVGVEAFHLFASRNTVIGCNEWQRNVIRDLRHRTYPE
jgi:hypothetical protein